MWPVLRRVQHNRLWAACQVSALNHPDPSSGVDYAGPIVFKQSTARNFKNTNVCMVTKALHLEAVTSLPTESLLAAFRRFISRHGN